MQDRRRLIIRASRFKSLQLILLSIFMLAAVLFVSQERLLRDVDPIVNVPKAFGLNDNFGVRAFQIFFYSIGLPFSAFSLLVNIYDFFVQRPEAIIDKEGVKHLFWGIRMINMKWSEVKVLKIYKFRAYSFVGIIPKDEKRILSQLPSWIGPFVRLLHVFGSKPAFNFSLINAWGLNRDELIDLLNTLSGKKVVVEDD